MSYEEAVAWLYGTQMHGIKLGLENIGRLATALKIELEAPAATIFHVAGTNGKGSVCAMLDAMLRAGGVCTGLYTSPHLISFRERIRVNGEPMSEDAVARGLAAIRAIVEGWEFPPTFFEVATALALAHFQAAGCAAVVLETGMGGRLDATNVVQPAVCVLTPVALDHQQWLGATLAEIAGEKAGIIKAGRPVVSAPQVEEVLPVFRARAAAVGASCFTVVEQPYAGCEMGLAGEHQRWNAALAVRALTASGIALSPEAISSGLASVQWPGRFQRAGPRLVLDGAHNPAAASCLVSAWREFFGNEQATLVLGILADKEVRAICAALLPLAAEVIVVPVKNFRSSAPEIIAALLHELDPRLPVRTAPDAAAGLRAAEAAGRLTLLAGSLFLVGEALALLHPPPGVAEQSGQ